MKLQQLETFFWTVRLGSFSAAAERLFTTQSTVSMRIRELERALGVDLFDRSARKAVLTAKGRELMEYATRIVDLSNEMVHHIAAPDTLAGTVRLGVAEVVSVTWLPSLIQTISSHYPHVHLEIEEALTGDLIEGLQQGDIDVMLAPASAPILNCSTLSLGSATFAWMASPSMRLPSHCYTAAELSELPIIGLKSQSFHRAAIEEWFHQDGARYRCLALCKSMGVAASMTKAGVGISYLPLRCHLEDIAQHRLEVIETTAAFRVVEFVAAVAYERRHPLAEAVAQLAQQTSDFDQARSSAKPLENAR